MVPIAQDSRCSCAVVGAGVGDDGAEKDTLRCMTTAAGDMTMHVPQASTIGRRKSEGVSVEEQHAYGAHEGL